MISFLMMILLFITTGISSGPRPDSKPRPNTETDIKKVDFLNFTYSSSSAPRNLGTKALARQFSD